MDVPSAIDSLEKKRKSKDKIKGDIKFSNVWFRYPSRKSEWVLRNLNMTIKHKENLAIVGESGGGKSTIMQLLLRFYDVD